jgi:hypothetical protein
MTAPLFLNGAFNHLDPWNIAPMYLWALVLWWIVIIPVAWFMLKKIKWDPFFKFHGLHYAKKNDSSCALISDDTGDTEMVAEHIAKCIFSYGEDDYEIEIPPLPLNLIKIAGIILVVIGIGLIITGNLTGLLLILIGIICYAINRVVPWVYTKLFWYPTKYLKDIGFQKALLYKIGKVNFDCKIAQQLQNGEWDHYPVVNCGGIPVEMVFDSDHWCERKSRQHKAIVKSAREYNELHEKDQVHTYTKYQRYLDNGTIEKPPEINKDYLAPWIRIDQGFPTNLKNVDWAGKLRQMAKTKENKDKGELNKYTLWLIVAGIILLIFIMLLKFALKVMAK